MAVTGETFAQQSVSSATGRERTELFRSPSPREPRLPSVLLNTLVFSVVMVIAFGYMHHYMLRGWVSHDDGTLAQTAERVLRGELPHRDFDDVYTGGLAYLNALAFRLFGPTLASLRYMLMIFALAWTAATYYCASRFLPILGAGLVTLLAVAWGPANYFAALPSWYNLFFATFGLAALLRYADARRLQWTFIAGACGGLSILFKLCGLYFVLAAGLWLIAGSLESRNDTKHASGKGQVLLVALVLCLYEIFLIRMAMMKWKLPYVFAFFAPAALAGLCLVVQRFRRGATHAESITSMRAAGAFVAGVAAPLTIFVIPYLRGGSLNSLIYGVFVEPAKRMQFVALLPLHPEMAWTAIALVLVLIAVTYVDWGFSLRLGRCLVILSLGFCVLRSAQDFTMYAGLWTALFVSLPLIIVLGSVAAAFGELPEADSKYRAKLFLVLVVTAMCSLIQFPYSAPNYFCYVAPLGVLAGAALVSGKSAIVKWNSSLLAMVLLVYAVWQVGPVFIHNLCWGNVKYEANYALRIPNAGGIRVPVGEGQVYDRLAKVIREHARGEYIFAAPDCPEVYFLTGHRNPTRTFYDFFADDKNNTASVIQLVRTNNITLIVLNSQPQFSPPMRKDLISTLGAEFPQHEIVGQFDVRWRE